jgi:hypothetical protein
VVFHTQPTRRKKENSVPFHIRELVTENAEHEADGRDNETMMTGLFIRLRRKLHKALTNEKNKTFEHYIASLCKDDHTIRMATKQFRGPQILIPPIRKADRSWAKSDREEATTFAGHLEHHSLT